MQAIHRKNLSTDFRHTSLLGPDESRTPIEHLVEFLLTGSLAPNAPEETEEFAEQVLRFDLKSTRVVVLGGGTGLSTVVGGNPRMPDWPDNPYVGMKQEFPDLHSVVCTTDDGGSTGLLLKSLPLIGVGDLRKLVISSILPENLRRRYGIIEQEAHQLVRLIHALFNYRFPEGTSKLIVLADPLKAVPVSLRPACPRPLADAFRMLGTYISPGGWGPSVVPAGHSLGNLMLIAAIFRAARGRTDRAPGLREIQTGIDDIAAWIGAPVGRIHPATAAPGQLKIRYANGVEVYGQSKPAYSRRNSPVERIMAEFARKPVVSAAVQQAIENADLIIYAPGSLYTSTIPVLQLEPIAASIRKNRKALKVLGANSWVQEGETDISLKNQGRGFLVSELIEAYDRNIPGGIQGLFDVVLSANLEHIPGSILRNYALEGKSPIHMDRANVEATGIQPVEATLFLPVRQSQTRVIQHDARRFALAIRTLLYADRRLKNKNGYALRRRAPGERFAQSPETGKRAEASSPNRNPLLCKYLDTVTKILSEKDFRPAMLRNFMLDIAWENRDIRPSHLMFFRGVRVISARRWNRSTEWDNVLGYYDPQDQILKLHKDLLANPARLREDLLIALGESLLGQYIQQRRWMDQYGARCFEIELRPSAQRECFLTDAQIRTYLRLARMTPDPSNDRIFRIVINNDGGFLPPGLLFGLIYSWYLCGSGLTMEYEMTLLRWPLKSLIPLHARDRTRKQALVTFFRKEIFGHREDE